LSEILGLRQPACGRQANARRRPQPRGAVRLFAGAPLAASRLGPRKMPFRFEPAGLSFPSRHCHSPDLIGKLFRRNS